MTLTCGPLHFFLNLAPLIMPSSFCFSPGALALSGIPRFILLFKTSLSTFLFNAGTLLLFLRSTSIHHIPLLEKIKCLLLTHPLFSLVFVLTNYDDHPPPPPPLPPSLLPRPSARAWSQSDSPSPPSLIPSPAFSQHHPVRHVWVNHCRLVVPSETC